MLCSHMKKTKDTPFLPFAGPVSLVKSAQSFKIASIFGINFYVQKHGADINGDVVVPAWAAVSVTRNDQAFFELQTRAKKLYLYLQKKEGMSVAQTLDQLVAGFVLSRDPPGDDIKHVIIDVVPCLFR